MTQIASFGNLQDNRKMHRLGSNMEASHWSVFESGIETPRQHVGLCLSLIPSIMRFRNDLKWYEMHTSDRSEALNQAGYVYIVGSSEHDFLKIGCSHSPNDRLSNLGNASPFPLKILHLESAPGYHEILEKRVHERLDEHRKRLEWFACPLDKAIEVIQVEKESILATSTFFRAKRPRRTAVQHLKELDHVFSLMDMQVKLELKYDVARSYAKRWANEKLTERFGDGVYFNLIRDPEGPKKRVREALDKLLGGLPYVAVGGYAVHSGGWTTQIHHRIHVAVPVIRGKLTVPETEGGVVLTPRYVNWFRKLLASAGSHNCEGLHIASPEYALADALLSHRRTLSKNRRVSIVPPDEMDMETFDADDLERLREAMHDLGGSEAEIAELTTPYEAAVSDTSNLLSF